MFGTILLVLSIVFQLGALYHAILLIRITGKRTAWLLISCVVFMMLVRRIGWLINLYFMEIALPYEWLHELVTLTISILLFFGIRSIEPLFVSRNVLIDDLEKALHDVKTLRGMIPICSMCKKIRDDRGFWKQVEEYVRDHTHAEFSHGLCPECIKKYYPEYCDESNDVKERTSRP